MTLKCGGKIWHQKSRIMGLPYGEEIMIVGRTIWPLATVRKCDRQIDGQIYND